MEHKEVISFDCYGTLIDWRKGLLDTLLPLMDQYFLDIGEDELFRLFKEYDREIISGEYIFYRSVLKEIMKKFSKDLNVNMYEHDLLTLQNALPNWKPFPDTVQVLKSLKNHYKIAVITNTDNDLFEATKLHLGVELDFVITSEDCRSYKPSQNNFIQALKSFDVSPDKVVHVAQSLHHDIIPTNELGIENIWVNRYGEKEPDDPLEIPGRILPDLKSLSDLF